MQKLQNLTCIRFQRYDGSQPDYVTITGAETGCWATVGRLGGEQLMNLQRNGSLIETGCFRLHTIIHELMHSKFGFVKECIICVISDWILSYAHRAGERRFREGQLG